VTTVLLQISKWATGIFSAAWISVNQGFSGRNIGRCLGKFLSVMTRFINCSAAESKRPKSISKKPSTPNRPKLSNAPWEVKDN
jgi:hypothetical protein